MSDPTFAEKDPDVVLSEALAAYKTLTGVTLSPGDPRRLHLQAVLLLSAQLRSLIDFAGKQNLLGYVSDVWIEALAELWGLTKTPAVGSTTTLRFTASTPGILTIGQGTRATDGNTFWAVDEDTTSEAGASYVDCAATCTETGADSNDVAIGQIDTIVDPIVGIASVSNLTATSGGSDVESLEDFRERIRAEPERFSVAGPRGAYEALAKAASAAVEDAVAIGPYDTDVAAPVDEGEVKVCIMEVGKATPSAGLIATVDAALSDETVRPLTDFVTVEAPAFVDYDLEATYYIARSRSTSATTIIAAVEAAFDGFIEWQRKINRDVNPSQLVADLMAAGAKRVVVSQPAAHVVIKRDQCSRLDYSALVYGGIEND